MTTNQIAYLRAQEEQRANQAQERLKSEAQAVEADRVSRTLALQELKHPYEIAKLSEEADATRSSRYRSEAETLLTDLKAQRAIKELADYDVEKYLRQAGMAADVVQAYVDLLEYAAHQTINRYTRSDVYNDVVGYLPVDELITS